MRLMPWVLALSVLVALIAWRAVADANLTDDRTVSDAEMRANERAIRAGDPLPGDPWWQEHPALTGIGAGLVVLVVGSVVVIAVASEKRR